MRTIQEELPEEALAMMSSMVLMISMKMSSWAMTIKIYILYNVY